MIDEVLIGLGGGGELGAVGARDLASVLLDGDDTFDGGDDDVLDGQRERRGLAGGFEEGEDFGEVLLIEGGFGGGEEVAVGFGFFVGEDRAGEYIELVFTDHRIGASKSEIPLGEFGIENSQH